MISNVTEGTSSRQTALIQDKYTDEAMSADDSSVNEVKAPIGTKLSACSAKVPWKVLATVPWTLEEDIEHWVHSDLFQVCNTT